MGFALGERAAGLDVYCLSGDLGAGKTVFAKGFARGLGITENVTSATFTIMNEYAGRLKLYHFDAYRLNPGGLEDTGLFDALGDGLGVCLIEWAETIRDELPGNARWVYIDKDLTKGGDYRLIRIE